MGYVNSPRVSEPRFAPGTRLDRLSAQCSIRQTKHYSYLIVAMKLCISNTINQQTYWLGDSSAQIRRRPLPPRLTLALDLPASLALWTDFPQDRAVLNLAPRKLDATSRKASYVA
jgi:hypothetical protein